MKSAKKIGKRWAMTSVAAVLATLLIAPLGVLFAENERHVSLGVRGAFYDPKDGDGTWYPGAQLRIPLGEALAVEGSVDYRKSDFGPVDVITWPVQASLLGYLATGDVKPYVLGGAGWYFTTIDTPNGDDTDNRFGFHAGGGLEVMLNEMWSVDGSYRYIWLEKFNSFDETNVTKKDYDDSGHMISAALNYHF